MRMDYVEAKVMTESITLRAGDLPLLLYWDFALRWVSPCQILQVRSVGEPDWVYPHKALFFYDLILSLSSCVMNRDLQNINFWPKKTLLTPFWSVRVNKWWRSFSRIVPKGYEFWAAGVKHGGADVIMRKDPRRSGHLLLCWQSSECCRDFREN